MAWSREGAPMTGAKRPGLAPIWKVGLTALADREVGCKRMESNTRQG